MQVATVSLEIFSEFCSWLDFSKQNKSAAPQWEIEKKGDRRETQKEGRARGRGKGHFLMMKDEDSRYHRKQSCKYSLLHTQFSEKEVKNLQGPPLFTNLLTDSLHPI